MSITDAYKMYKTEYNKEEPFLGTNLPFRTHILSYFTDFTTVLFYERLMKYHKYFAKEYDSVI